MKQKLPGVKTRKVFTTLYRYFTLQRMLWSYNKSCGKTASVFLGRGVSKLRLTPPPPPIFSLATLFITELILQRSTTAIFRSRKLLVRIVVSVVRKLLCQTTCQRFVMGIWRVHTSKGGDVEQRLCRRLGSCCSRMEHRLL